MRLYKSLLIDGQEFELVRENIALDIDRPGRAVFQVAVNDGQEINPKGLVQYSIGANYADRMTLFLTADIDELEQVDGKQWRMLCRELTGRLDGLRPLALRHPTLKEVLTAYSGLTGLEFVLPERHYSSLKVPAFYGVGTGFHAFSNIGQVFSIDDYIWQSQGDGRVFVGAWADSRWKGKEIELDRETFKKVGTAGAKTITAMPNLRPGAVLNGRRIKSLTLAGHEMRLTNA